MHELHRHRALADRGGDALHGPRAHVAGGEDARPVRLERQRRPLPVRPRLFRAATDALKKNLKGRHLTAEAAASDDLGHAAAFAFAGTLDVTR